jgi:CRP-like cAMP-binding protein
MIDLWHLTDIDWLSELSGESAERLRQAAELASFAKGELVFGPESFPDKVFILESGLIRIYRASVTDDEVTFGYVRPGEIFGESALFDDQSRDSQAAAVEPSSVLILPRDAFIDAMRDTPRIGYSVAMQVEGRFKKIESRVEDLVFRSVRNRLARILLQLSEQFGERNGKGILLPVKLTQQDLATLIGASRPTVSLAMSELQDAKLIGRQGRRISITDVDLLAASVDRH